MNGMGLNGMVRVALGAVFMGSIVGCTIPEQNFEPVNGQHEERRVNMYNADGQWLIQSSNIIIGLEKEPARLSLFNLSDGTETILEEPWRGGRGLTLQGTRAAYLRAPEKGKGSELVVYDIEKGEGEVVAKGGISSIDIFGDTLVWMQGGGPFGVARLSMLRLDGESKVKTLGTKDRPVGATYASPKVTESYVLWERMTKKPKAGAVMMYNLATEETTELDVKDDDSVVFDASGDRITYRLRRTKQIHVYDLKTGEDEVIAEVENAFGHPRIGGDTVVWVTERPEKKIELYRFDKTHRPNYYRTLHTYDLKTGKASEAASMVFFLRFIHVGSQGRPFAIVDRTSERAAYPICDIIGF